MNIYFLVEGRTEAKIYPQWLSHLLPELTKVKYHDQVVKNNYYLFKGNGYPHIIDVHLPHAIEDVNTVGRYDYLVMFFDADESSVSERIAEVNEHVLKLIGVRKNLGVTICASERNMNQVILFDQHTAQFYLTNCLTDYDCGTFRPFFCWLMSGSMELPTPIPSPP